MRNNDKIGQIYLVCTGLGKVSRGFETYIEDLANLLITDANFNKKIAVVSGGKFKNNNFESNKVQNISRNNKLLQYFIKDIHLLFEIEQFTFFLSFIPRILIHKPKVIYLGEYNLYCYLFRLRHLLQLDYSLVLYTGGQACPGLFNPKKDFVHHITDVYLDQLVQSGVPINRQFLIPHFIETENSINDDLYSSIVEKAKGRRIILAVGSLDNKVKRLDVLIESLKPVQKKVYPIFLGDETTETHLIKKKLTEVFGEDNFLMRKAGRTELSAYYSAADILASFSLHESFGLVNIEAMVFGTPVICHDYKEARFVLKDSLELKKLDRDLYFMETLVNSLSALVKYPELRKFSIELYGKNQLKDSYINMFNIFLDK